MLKDKYMIILKYSIHILLFSLTNISCDCKPIRNKSDLPIISDFNKQLKEYKSIIFRSWNGKWIGTDCDADITFLQNHDVKLTRYGYVQFDYFGTYNINENLEVSCNFKNYNPKWLIMNLKKDSISLLLYPKNDSCIIMGNRGGEPIVNNNECFWPFRQVTVINNK